MAPFDVLWHVLNLFAAPVGVGVLAAGAAKLLWRRELAGVPLRRLAAFGCGAGAIMTIAGLMWFGRDGRIGTYAATTVACALGLWWAGFGPGRR